MSKYPPRDYQELGVAMSSEALKRWRRIILCMPTGSGKTVTFMEMFYRALNKGKRCMMIADRVELIGQSADKAADYDLYPTIIDPGYKGKKGQLYIASVQTLINREPPDIDFLVLDEAHKLIFNKVLDNMYPKVKTVGATATPVRTAKHSLHLHYGEIVEPTNIPKLLVDGHLNPCRTIAPKGNIDLANIPLKKNSLTGEMDYDPKEQFKRFNKSEIYGEAVDLYLQFTPGEKAIVFCIDVEHSIKTCEKFRERGVECYHVDGNTPKWLRKQILDDYNRIDRYFVLCNCEIFTTGLDIPSITSVITFRKIGSLSLYLQIPGRGSRLCPEIGKTHFTHIDMAKNYIEHGFWEEDRTFKLITEKSKRATDSVAPVKECPKCESIMYASATACKFCGHAFPVSEQKFIEGGEYEVIRPAIIAKDKKSNRAETWNMSDEEIIKYGERMNYKPGWAHKQISMRSSNLKVQGLD